jgi:hypothetical protein
MIEKNPLRIALRALDELLSEIDDDEPTQDQALEIQRLVREIYQAAGVMENGHEHTD